VLLLVAGCSGGTGGGKDDSPSHAAKPAREAVLEDVLAFAPARPGTAYVVSYTNWRAIASALDASGTDLLVRADELGAPFSYVQPTKLWKQRDVEWEARLGPDGEHEVAVVAFREDFSFDAVTRFLNACGLSHHDENGVRVYSDTLQGVAACAGDFGTDIPFYPAIAVDADRGVVLLAHSMDALRSSFRGEGDVATDPDIGALLASIPDVQTLTMEVRTPLCGADRSLAIGVHYGKRGADGSVVVRYADAGAAEDDVAVREQALREGRSVVSDRPYSDLLRVEDARADGRNIVLDVAPAVRSTPLVLGEMYQRADLAFTGC
jgi:hypothetical protein